MRISILLQLIILTLINTSVAQPQQINFPVEFETSQPLDFPALQSFCWAQHEGKWLLMSGRNNGLHAFQPPFAFPEINQNTEIFVYNPSNGNVSFVSVNGLPPEVAEQVSSSNLEFHQFEDNLLLVGGYGYSNIDGAYKTFPSALWIDVPGLIGAIENSEPIGEYFQRIEDDRMAVCGGYLGHIGNQYFLTLGHRFDGRYNPFNGGSYTQTYTDEIRFFEITEDGGGIAISNYDAWWNQDHFHRRDYNLAPQIFPDGSFGFTVFTGVFQRDVNLPHKTSIHFNENGYEVDSSFTQLLNQYHTAFLPMHSAIDNTMQTLFFGGIGEYYLGENNQIIQDSLVPFTKTISLIHQDSDGIIEGWLPVQLDEFAGASASFIPDLSAPFDQNLILNLDLLPQGRIHVGSIVGGIVSDSKNTFMQATGTTMASDKIIEVFINTEVLKAQMQNAASKPVINQTAEGIFIQVPSSKGDNIHVDILDASGKAIFTLDETDLSQGKLIPYTAIDSSKGVAVCRITHQGFIHSKKLLLNR